MNLKEDFIKNSIIEQIKHGNFALLTNKDITVNAARGLIDKYYKPPVDEIVQEAVEAGLTKNAESFKESVLGATGQGDENYGYGRRSLRRDFSFDRMNSVSEKEFNDSKMIIDDGRLSAKLYFTLGAGDNDTMLAWSDKRSNNHSFGRGDSYSGTYLRVDDTGRIYLKAAKPVLAARDVTVDARVSWDKGYQEQEKNIKAALEKGRQLTMLGLNDPKSRARDSYVSGRHYSSLDLLVNERSADVLPTTNHGGWLMVDKSVLGSGEIERRPHSIRGLTGDNYERITLSVRGNRAFDGGTYAQIGHVLKEDVSNFAQNGDMASAQDVMDVLLQMALQK